MSALDKSYNTYKSNYVGYYPVHRFDICYENLCENELIEKEKYLISVIREFKNHLNKYQNEPLSYDKPENLKCLQYKFDKKNKIFYGYLNHQNLGGPDFLLLLKLATGHVFDNLVKDNINLIIKKYYATLTLYNSIELYLKPKNITGVVTKISSKMNIPPKNFFKTKVVIIFKYLYDLISCTDRKELHCFILMSFERNSNNSAVNNLGMLYVKFKKDTTMNELNDMLFRNSYSIIGTKHILDSQAMATDTGQQQQDHFRKRIDVILSMINLKSDGNTPDKINASQYRCYFGDEMNIEYAYPVYIFSLTINNKIHVTHSIAAPDINCKKLCKNINGSIFY